MILRTLLGLGSLGINLVQLPEALQEGDEVVGMMSQTAIDLYAASDAQAQVVLAKRTAGQALYDELRKKALNGTFEVDGKDVADIKKLASLKAELDIEEGRVRILQDILWDEIGETVTIPDGKTAIIREGWKVVAVDPQVLRRKEAMKMADELTASIRDIFNGRKSNCGNPDCADCNPKQEPTGEPETATEAPSKQEAATSA